MDADEEQLRRGLASFEAHDWIAAAADLLPLADAGHAEAELTVAEMYAAVQRPRASNR
jgi:hypothetical protein